MMHSLLRVTRFLGIASVLFLGLNTPLTAQVSYLHHSGSQLISPSGSPVQLKGAMLEYTYIYCEDSTQFADGPTDSTDPDAMASWGLNAVRIPLNESCWLGINGATLGGSAYQQDVINLVNNFTAAGFYVILSEHIVGPGTTLATQNEPMADEDHSSAFWTGVASTFKDNGNVIFDLYNEPHNISWDCWLNGCQTTDNEGAQYQTAGMQELMTTVRNTGAGNFVIVGGLDWAYDLSDWLAYAPSDPDNNFGASTHVYDKSPSSDITNVLAGGYPVIAGEFGSLDGDATQFANQVPFYNSNGVSYIAWTWDVTAFNTGSNLITDWSGTPSSYGQAYKDTLAPSGNLLVNPSFATGSESPWTTWVGSGSSSDVYVQACNGNIPCPSGTNYWLGMWDGSNPYYVSANQIVTGQPVGANFTASVWAYTGSDATAQLVVQDGAGGAQLCSASIPANNGAWTEYSCTGTVGSTGTLSYSLVSGDTNPANSWLTLDNASLTLTLAPPPNLLSNPSFATGSESPWTTWVGSGSSSDVYVQACNGNIPCPSGTNYWLGMWDGSNPYYVSANQIVTGQPVGANFTASVWAYTGSDATAQLVVQDGAGGAQLCSASIPANNGAWTEYSCTGTVGSTGTLSYSLVSGDTNPTNSWLTLDNASLTD